MLKTVIINAQAPDESSLNFFLSLFSLGKVKPQQKNECATCTTTVSLRDYNWIRHKKKQGETYGAVVSLHQQ